MVKKTVIKKYIADFKRYRTGIIVGAIVGVIASAYLISQGINLGTIAQAGEGLLDNALGRTAPVEIATYKLYGVLIFLGASIGYLAESIMYSRGYKVRGRSKRKRRFLI